MTQKQLCKFLDWDTEFFGYRIGRVIPTALNTTEADLIDEWATEQAIDCIYFLADDTQTTVQTAEDHSYRLHDIRVVLDISLPTTDTGQLKLAPQFTIDTAHIEDQEALLPLAHATFTDSRFYHDPHFSQEQCDKLYETWLLRSLDRSFADIAIKINHEEEACAYITGKLDHDTQTGVIGIVGVSAKMRGHSLGVHLINSILTYFHEQGMQRCEVTTQARNIAAQRLYQKCSFRTAQVQLWYHKWYR